MAGAVLIVAGCGAERGNDQKAAAAAPAPNSAEPAPAPPGEVASRRVAGLEAKLLPPGAVIGADPDPDAPWLVFLLREKPEALLDWFRATANGADFVLESEMQEGAEYVFSGRARASADVFTVRLAPGVNGGTTGMLLVAR
jgi:hypothetical protein